MTRPEHARVPLVEEGHGRVLSVHGSQATVGMPAPPIDAPDGMRPTVGKFLGIQSGKTLLVGMITDVSAEMPSIAREHGYHSTADLDLMGEIKEDASGTPRFSLRMGA